MGFLIKWLRIGYARIFYRFGINRAGMTAIKVTAAMYVKAALKSNRSVMYPNMRGPTSPNVKANV